MNLNRKTMPTKEELKERYAELTDEELLKMHASHQLTNFAHEVLEAEFRQRRIVIPKDGEKFEQNREKINGFSLVSAVSACFIIISNLLFFAILAIFPAPPPHASPAFSPAFPATVFGQLIVLVLVVPLALITGMIALKDTRGSESATGHIYAVFGLVVAAAQILIILLV